MKIQHQPYIEIDSSGLQRKKAVTTYLGLVFHTLLWIFPIRRIVQRAIWVGDVQYYEENNGIAILTQLTH